MIEPDAVGRGAPRRRRRGLRAVLAVLVLSAVGVAAVAWTLTGRTLSLPAWVSQEAEQRINESLGGPRVSLGGLEITLDWRALPRLSMRNVGVFDAQGAEIARLNEVGARLDTVALIQGEVVPRRLRLSGAQVTLRRRADGTLDLSFGGRFEASGTLAGVLDRIDRTFATGALTGVDTIIADQLTISLEDARSGRVWQVTDGRLELAQLADRIELRVAAEIFNGTEDLAEAEFVFSSVKGSPEAALTARFSNAAAVDIAAQSPALAFLAVLDAPIAGTLDTAIGGDGTIERLSGTLIAGAGALRPDPAARPIRFGGAQTRFSYHPALQKIELEDVSVETEAVQMRASGHAYLGEIRAGWPGALIGQFRARDLRLAPEGLFEDAIAFSQAALDFRLRLDPFTVEIGQLALVDGTRHFVGDGRVAADSAGWHVGMDLTLNAIEPDRLLALWPVKFAPGTRNWLTENLSAGSFYDVEAALRVEPEQAPRLSVSYKFRDAVVRYLRHLPPVEGAAGYASILNNAYTMVLEDGHVTAPDGGRVGVAATVVQIPDVTAKPSRALVALRTEGEIPSVLALMDLPPFELMQKGGTSPDAAEGTAQLSAGLAFDIVEEVTLEGLDFRVTGTLTDVRSERLVAGRVLAADRLDLRADRRGIEIGGPVRLGGARLNASWIKVFGPEGRGKSRVEGSVELSQAFLDEFGIALPPGSVRGTGTAQVLVSLQQGTPPALSLISDLNRLTLAISALGWTKPANVTGRLEVTGRLGDRPAIDRLVLDAPGLSAVGTVTLAEGGGLDAARFTRVRAGNWLDAAVTLEGRGRGVAPATRIEGGTLDLRGATLGEGDGGGAGAPLRASLDRLVISDGLMLTEFTGQFATDAGLDGSFSARINGGTGIRGRVVPQDGRSAFRITSGNAGGVMADARTLRNIRGGELDLILRPSGADSYDGRLLVRGARLVGAPTLTELLSAISVVGLLEQMNAEGIGLDTIEADFRLSRDLLTLFSASAIGPSLGISLDGRYDLRTKRMDMQGVLSPFYFVNSVGQVLTRRGEGLFGFNFSMTGAADSPRVQVNPLSILTPGMFRDIFRRPPPARASGEASQ